MRLDPTLRNVRFVKVFSADQREADLLWQFYRWLRLRDAADERPFSSLRRTVEHEAFISLKARDGGVRTVYYETLGSPDVARTVVGHDPHYRSIIQYDTVQRWIAESRVELEQALAAVERAAGRRGGRHGSVRRGCRVHDRRARSRR